MKCYNHPENEAVAQCLQCGKGLCEICAKKWSRPVCDDCQRANINEELEPLNHELTIYIALAIFGAIFGFLTYRRPDMSLVASTIYGALAFPMYAAGWKWLNHITDSIVFFATPIGWIIYLLIKLVISAFVGIVALPYRIFYIFKRSKELLSLREYCDKKPM